MHKNSLLPGTVVRLVYFSVLGKRRKVFKFSGLCIANRGKTGFVMLRNKFLKEFVEVRCSLKSPYLLDIKEDKSFTFKKIFKKMYYRNNIRVCTKLASRFSLTLTTEKFYFTDFLFTFDFFFRFINKKFIRQKYRLKTN